MKKPLELKFLDYEISPIRFLVSECWLKDNYRTSDTVFRVIPFK